MSIQLARELRVFLTNNIDNAGIVDLNGLNQNNTVELVIQSDSFTAQQSRSYDYVDLGNLLESNLKTDAAVKTNQDIGTMSFVTLLSSSKTGPVDLRLWNALLYEVPYPNDSWEIATTYLKTPLVRTTALPRPFGIILALDKSLYVYDACRVSGVSLNFDLSNLANCSWTLQYEQLRIVSGTKITENKTIYSITGTVTGTVLKNKNREYKYANPGLVKVSVYDSALAKLGTLASTGLSLNITNTLNYIPDNNIDRTGLSQLFAGAGSYSVTGSVSFYTRAPGTFTGTFINSLLDSAQLTTDPIFRGYGIELPLTKTKNLCEIFLPHCSTILNTEFSQVLTNTADFKMTDSQYINNSYIKFTT